MRCLSPQKLPISKRLQSVHLQSVKHIVQERNATHFLVPCGNCIYCRMSKALSLATRVSLDWTARDLIGNDNIYFCTLTYNDDNVPITSNGNLTLSVDHMKEFYTNFYDFFHPVVRKDGKLIRENDPDIFEYFICGEYGGQTHRPHYHCIIMCPLDENQFLDKVHKFWTYGNIDVVPSSEMGVGAVSYVASFHSVKTGLFHYSKLKNAVPQHIDSYVREVSNDIEFVMPICKYSRPAIGTFYLRSNHPKVVDFRNRLLSQHTPFPTFYEPLSNKAMTLPVIDNYYDQMFSDEQRFLRFQKQIDSLDIFENDPNYNALFDFIVGKSNSLNSVISDINVKCEKELKDTLDAILKRKL